MAASGKLQQTAVELGLWFAMKSFITVSLLLSGVWGLPVRGGVLSALHPTRPTLFSKEFFREDTKIQNDWIPHPERRSTNSLCIPSNSSLMEYSRHVLRKGEIPLYPADMDLDVEDMEQVPISEKRSWEDHPLFQRKRTGNGCREASGVSGAPVAHRSLCPWEWVISRDPQRIPVKLLQAKCLCPHRPTGMGYECEAVRVSQKVLRFDPTCDGYRYAEDVVQLGCVAVMSVARQIPSSPAVNILLGPQMET